MELLSLVWKGWCGSVVFHRKRSGGGRWVLSIAMQWESATWGSPTGWYLKRRDLFVLHARL